MSILFPLIATLLPIAAPAPAPQVARIPVSPNAVNRSMAFEWDGKSIGGTAHGIPIYRVIFKYTNPQLPAATKEVIVDLVNEVDGNGGTTKIPMAQALKDVGSGDWDAQVALEDVAGQRGPFSAVTDQTRFTVIVNPPSAPKNVRGEEN